MNIWIDGTYGSGKSLLAKELSMKIDNSILYKYDDYIDEWKKTNSNDLVLSILLFYGSNHSNKYIMREYKEFLENKLSSDDINIIDMCLLHDAGMELIYNYIFKSCDKHIILNVAKDIMMQRLKKQPNRDIQLAETYYSECTAFISKYPDALILDNSEDDDFEKNIKNCLNYIFE